MSATDPRKTKLASLTKEVLADALLQCAARSSEADEIINRLLATPEENIARFKKKLSGLKRRRRFVSYRESFELARELEMLLQDLESGVDDPLEGVKLIVAFYEADEGVLGSCDDSSGSVGDVYRYDAKNLFVNYAKRCDEKQKIAKILLKLNQKDSYGVRDTLIYCAKEYLPEEVLRSMISALQKSVAPETDEWVRRHHFRLIESLAEQTNDPKLFEEARIAAWGEPGPAAIVDIARVYLHCGDVAASQRWIEKFPKGESFRADERDRLLADLYKAKGDTENLQEVLYKRFRASRSKDRLEELVAAVGEGSWEEVAANEVALLHKSAELSLGDMDFLISINRIDDAERYMLERAPQLDGRFYDYLLAAAKVMESNKRHLVASLLYRALLEAILEKANTKAYSHGARYLKKLDVLAESVGDWQGHESHEVFRDRVGEQHRLKKSFWAQV